MKKLKADVLVTALAMNASRINSGSAGNVSARSGSGFIITPTGMAYDDCDADDMVCLGDDGEPSVGADKTTDSKTTDETTAQQERAGQNPAHFAADALQDGRAKDALFAVADDVECRLSTADPMHRREAAHCETPASPALQQRQPSSEWRFHRDIYVAHPDVGAIVHAHSPFATALACHGMSIPAFHYMVARFGGNNVRCAAYATFGTQALSDAILIALRDRNACLIANHGMVVCSANLKRALALAMELESLAEQYWRVLQIGTPILLGDEEMKRVLVKFSNYGQPC